jgi:hypothetical protein
MKSGLSIAAHAVIMVFIFGIACGQQADMST